MRQTFDYSLLYLTFLSFIFNPPLLPLSRPCHSNDDAQDFELNISPMLMPAQIADSLQRQNITLAFNIIQ